MIDTIPETFPACHFNKVHSEGFKLCSTLAICSKIMFSLAKAQFPNKIKDAPPKI